MGHLGHDRDGAFAGYFVQRADRVRNLPDEVTAIAGALLEPVAVCLQAISRAGSVLGRTVLIAGDGPFGNLIARLAVWNGASRVIVVGHQPFRLSRIPGVETCKTPPQAVADIAILAVSSAEAVSECLARCFHGDAGRLQRGACSGVSRPLLDSPEGVGDCRLLQ